MSAAIALENFSVPSPIPVAYTKPGIRDFVIWMKLTLRYRYAEFDSHKLAAYRIPIPRHPLVSPPWLPYSPDQDTSSRVPMQAPTTHADDHICTHIANVWESGRRG